MRDLAAATLRLVVEALAEGRQQPRLGDPGPGSAGVAGQLGADGLRLHRHRPRPARRLAGRHDPTTPTRLADRVRLAKGHWQGERAARDILALASKGRAFRSLGSLITRQGGQHVLYGSALALTATIRTWSTETATPMPELARTTIR